MEAGAELVREHFGMTEEQAQVCTRPSGACGIITTLSRARRTPGGEAGCLADSKATVGVGTIYIYIFFK